MKYINQTFLSQDAQMKIEGVMQSQPFKWDGNVNLEYSTQRFTFSGKIADESSGRNSKYVAEAKATHPGIYLDVDFKSALENDRESMGGNMELKYKTTRDRQMKNMALRATINKLRDELNLEVGARI